MSVLVLGAGGMLGNSLLRFISQRNDTVVYGTLRSNNVSIEAMAPNAKFIHGVDAYNSDSIVEVLDQTRPQVVINCIGLIKQAQEADIPLKAIFINSFFPHQLANLCKLTNSRLIHISSDCVYSGKKGSYSENDNPDPQDLYGLTKLLGEVSNDQSITIRTSIIGHELYNSRSLIDWFLSQQDFVKGYTQAIYSGLPTCELARVICDYIIPFPKLHGLYHVASAPISKFDLLKLVAHEYAKVIKIEPDDLVKINRSLNGSRFSFATGYLAPSWPELVSQMKNFR